jgi:hypothetical protein
VRITKLGAESQNIQDMSIFDNIEESGKPLKKVSWKLESH